MSALPAERLDEVAQYYQPAQRLNFVRRCLFFGGAALSFAALYADAWGQSVDTTVRIAFLASAITYFVCGELLRLHVVPRAEDARRRQLLSDGIGTRLTHDRTDLYYNNEFRPSIDRLGANTMENALFSQAISERMLIRKRFTVGAYLLVWFLIFASRGTSLDVLTWVTQVVFSQAVITQWLNLEALRMRFAHVFGCLHSHHLHGRGSDSPSAVAAILDSVITFEAAKAASGILLSSADFNSLNPSLSKAWDRVRHDLGMDLEE